MNGEKIGIAVKQIVSGSNLQPSGTVANPESVKAYLILKSKVNTRFEFRMASGNTWFLIFLYFPIARVDEFYSPLNLCRKSYTVSSWPLYNN